MWEPAPGNALLVYFRARLTEGALLFHGAGLGRAGEMDALPREPRRVRGKGTVFSRAWPLLEKWRDSCRVWACTLYAFAVPNPDALDTLAALGPVVEVGAGTGYWARLLQQRGVDVVALDRDPPAPKPQGGRRNEWHGHAPPWTRVQPGGPADLAAHSGRTLLLVYPPPGSPFAEECLQSFGGDRVAHVGEWWGETGSHAFQRRLSRDYELERSVPLPNFGDTAYGLTVWRRRPAAAAGDVGAGEEGGRAPAPEPLLRCAGCRAFNVPLRRCRYTRSVCFCGEACFRAGRRLHRERLAERLLFFDRDLELGGRRDFQTVGKGFRRRPGAGAMASSPPPPAPSRLSGLSPMAKTIFRALLDHSKLNP